MRRMDMIVIEKQAIKLIVAMKEFYGKVPDS